MRKPEFELRCFIQKEGRLYSAICLELDVASQGKTTQEAFENLKEAVNLYLEDVIESGDQKRFLKRPAPYSIWQKYYKAYSKHILQSLRGSHPPRITLQPVSA